MKEEAVRYHVNPKTGNANKCRANRYCPFGGAAVHFATPEEARTYYEEASAANLFNNGAIRESPWTWKPGRHPLSPLFKELTERGKGHAWPCPNSQCKSKTHAYPYERPDAPKSAQASPKCLAVAASLVDSATAQALRETYENGLKEFKRRDRHAYDSGLSALRSYAKSATDFTHGAVALKTSGNSFQTKFRNLRPDQIANFLIERGVKINGPIRDRALKDLEAEGTLKSYTTKGAQGKKAGLAKTTNSPSMGTGLNQGYKVDHEGYRLSPDGKKVHLLRAELNLAFHGGPIDIPLPFEELTISEHFNLQAGQDKHRKALLSTEEKEVEDKGLFGRKKTKVVKEVVKVLQPTEAQKAHNEWVDSLPPKASKIYHTAFSLLENENPTGDDMLKLDRAFKSALKEEEELWIKPITAKDYIDSFLKELN